MILLTHRRQPTILDLRAQKIRLAKSKLVGILHQFMPTSQISSLNYSLRSEEAEGIAEIILRAASVIESMPKTYDTEDQGENALIYLHYFRGNYDAWITEKDCLEEQLQAFGKASFCRTDSAEFGYISIVELLENNVELDLYWKPIPIGSLGNTIAA